MSSDRLRLAAQAMRRERTAFHDAVADLLDYEAGALKEFGPIWQTAKFEAVADAYLNDPGDLPAAITGGAQ